MLFRMKILFLFSFVFFLHCTSKSNNTNTDTVFILLDSQPKTLDPRKATDANGMRIVNLIFNGLVKVGPDLQAAPDAAISWKRSGLTYQFTLRDNLMFSNGDKVTPEDVVFSFNEYKKRSSRFYFAFKNIEKVQAKKMFGKTVLSVTLKEFSAPFLSADLPVIKILPKKVITQVGDDFYKNPIGSGLFKLKKNDQHSLVLERQKSVNNKPKYLSFVITRDSFTRVQKTLSGQVDIAPSVIPPNQIKQFKNNSDFKVITQPALSITYLLLNLKNKTLANLKVRQALAHSINREEIIKHKLSHFAKMSNSLLNPSSYFFNKKLKNVGFNLIKARSIIEQLGLKGEKIILSVSNNKDTIDKAKALISQLTKTGLIFKLESYEWGVFYNDINKGNYDIALSNFVGVTDPDIYRIAFHSDNHAPKGRNRSFYSNKTLDKLLDQGYRETSNDKRRKIYNQVQSLILRDKVIIPLWYNMDITVLKSNIKGYIQSKNGDFSNIHLLTK